MDDDTILIGPVHPSIPIQIIALVVVVGMVSLALYSEYKRNRLRYSLRTLLVATTLIATVLGIIVWMSRAR